MADKTGDPIDNMARFFAGQPQAEAQKEPERRMSDMMKPIAPELEARIMALSPDAISALAIDLMQNLTPDEQEAAVSDAESQSAPPAPENKPNEEIDYESGMAQ